MHTDRIEEFLQGRIFPDLERGRPGWDKPHTQTVIHYLKQILSNASELSLDREILMIAAYAHDWGYAGLFKEGVALTYDDVLDAKKRHMELGAQYTTEMLADPFFSFLSESRKARAIHLVAVHDKLKQLKDTDELILMEADTLGGLDTSHMKPFSDRASTERYLEGVRKKRIPLFITAYGKQKAEALMKQRMEHAFG